MEENRYLPSFIPYTGIFRGSLHLSSFRSSLLLTELPFKRERQDTCQLLFFYYFMTSSLALFSLSISYETTVSCFSLLVCFTLEPPPMTQKRKYKGNSVASFSYIVVIFFKITSVLYSYIYSHVHPSSVTDVSRLLAAYYSRLRRAFATLCATSSYAFIMWLS